MKILHRFLALALILVLAGCASVDRAQKPDPRHVADKELDLLLDWMSGSFSSARQAAADSSFFEIELEMVPIWTGDAGARWLYVEQAVAAHKQAPYRQRVYRVSRLDDGRIESAVFRLPGQERFVGAYTEPARLDILTPDSLVVREGCAIYLERVSSERFGGSTNERDCVSSLHGASYATSQVEIGQWGMMSWDRGFDESGEQVWGAVTGGYYFDRIR